MPVCTCVPTRHGLVQRRTETGIGHITTLKQYASCRSTSPLQSEAVDAQLLFHFTTSFLDSRQRANWNWFSVGCKGFETSPFGTQANLTSPWYILAATPTNPYWTSVVDGWTSGPYPFLHEKEDTITITLWASSLLVGLTLTVPALHAIGSSVTCRILGVSSVVRTRAGFYM